MNRLQQTWAKVCTKAFGYFFAWKIFTLVFVFLNLWAFFESDALPPGDLFHMLMLFLAAHFMGKLSNLFNLPPLFGMLFAGFIYGNVFDIELNKLLVSTTRSLALMIILLRAGLNLDPAAIKKLSFVCFRLAFIPCLVEASTVAICAYFLFDLSIGWSLMLGFVLGAVSPAVVVPGMIKLQETKLGVAKGIPTLIIAAASIDDVLAITGFSVCLSFAFAKSDQSSGDAWILVKSILKGPFEAAVGILYGVVVGTLLWFMPEPCANTSKNMIDNRYDLHRFVLLLLAGLFALFGSQVFDLGGSGPLAILVMPFVASLRWRRCAFEEFNENALKLLWIIFQHYLFCLIGSDVRIKSMQSEVLLYGLVCLVIGVGLRTLAAFLVTYGIGLNNQERLFTAIAWLPKATVQAAIGPLALDLAITADEMRNGRLVLTIAVLSILITAPLGAIAIDMLSTRLLIADVCDTGDMPSRDGSVRIELAEYRDGHGQDQSTSRD